MAGGGRRAARMSDTLQCPGGIQIPRLNICPELFLDRCIAFYGPSGTGKSVFVKDLMYELRGHVPQVIVVNPQKVKATNLKELLEFIRKNPAKLNYGSGGNGSAGHLAGEMFKQRAGIYALHIPYRGANPAQLALLAGEVDFNIDNLAAAAPNIRSGKLKALAVTSLEASSALPGVPTMASTFKGFSIDTWWGLVAPKDTPKPVVDKLNRAFVAALQAPETKTRFGALLAEPVPTTPQQFESFMASERAKYKDVVKLSGAKVD